MAVKGKARTLVSQLRTLLAVSVLGACGLTPSKLPTQRATPAVAPTRSSSTMLDSESGVRDLDEREPGESNARGPCPSADPWRTESSHAWSSDGRWHTWSAQGQSKLDRPDAFGRIEPVTTRAVLMGRWFADEAGGEEDFSSVRLEYRSANSRTLVLSHVSLDDLGDWRLLKEQMLVPATGSTIAYLVPFASGAPLPVELPTAVCARGQVPAITTPLAEGRTDALLSLWCGLDDSNEEGDAPTPVDRRVTVLLDARHALARVVPIETLGIGREHALFRDTRAELVIVHNPTRVAEVWSTRDGTLVREVPLEVEPSLRANCAALSADERSLIAMTEDGELASFSLETGRTRRVSLIPQGPIRCTLDARSTRVVVVTADEVLQVSQPEFQVKRVRFHGGRGAFESRTVSANGAYVASLRDDDKLDVVDVASMQVTQLTLPDTDPWSYPSFDPASRYLGFGAAVYRVGSWQRLAHYETPKVPQ